MAQVSGTVVFPSKVNLQESDLVQINFVSDVKEVKGRTALFSKENKSFVCKQLTPGAKYKITVVMGCVPGPESAKRAKELEPINKMYDASSSKLSYQLTDDSQQSIALDLEKGTVTKN
jgi:hypothetical protein